MTCPLYTLNTLKGQVHWFSWLCLYVKTRMKEESKEVVSLGQLKTPNCFVITKKTKTLVRLLSIPPQGNHH